MSAFENYDAETAVIGSMLQDLEAVKKARVLSSTDFFRPEYQSVYIVCMSLFHRGEPVDLVTVAGELQKRHSAVTPEMLMEAVRRVPSTVNAEAYVSSVKEASNRRKIAELGRKMMHDAADGGMDLSEILDAARGDLRKLVNGGGKWLTAQDLAFKTIDWLETLQKGDRPVVKSGVADLDWMIGGFYPGELEIIGARPGVGKSAFALQIILSAAQAGKKVALISQEMSPQAIGERIASRLSGVSGARLHKGEELNPDEWADVMDGLNILSNQPFYSRYSVRSIEQLWQDVQTLYDREGLDMLVVDYMQLVHSDRKTAGRVEEVELVSNSLKTIAMELNIPVVGLAQVRRSGSREAVMPVMDELKGSGALEQDASKIILLHRPESNDDACLDEDGIELKVRLENQGKQLIVADVAKHREGQTGMVRMAFDPDKMSYTCIKG